MEEQEEALEDELDLVYRVNSSFAEKKLPRDVIAQFVTSRMKEDILQQFKSPLEIDGKRILILKEIPRKALALRKKYRTLTEALSKQNIKFRWELPEGVSFQYKGTRHNIKNEQIEAFTKMHNFDISQ